MLRQGAERKVEQVSQFCGRDIAYGADDQIVAGETASDKCLHIHHGNGLQTFLCAAFAPAIWMIGEEDIIELASGDGVRVFFLPIDTDQYLAADAVDGLVVEARRRHSLAQHIEGGATVFAQRSQ